MTGQKDSEFQGQVPYDQGQVPYVSLGKVFGRLRFHGKDLS